MSLLKALISPSIKTPVYLCWAHNFPNLIGFLRYSQNRLWNCTHRIESKLLSVMTFQRLQNLASTWLCRPSFHHLPQGTLCSCQSLLSHAFPSSEVFPVLFLPQMPTPTPPALLLIKYCVLVLTLHNVTSLGNSLLLPGLCLYDEGSYFLLQCHWFLNMGQYAAMCR